MRERALLVGESFAFPFKLACPPEPRIRAGSGLRRAEEPAGHGAVSRAEPLWRLRRGDPLPGGPGGWAASGRGTGRDGPVGARQRTAGGRQAAGLRSLQAAPARGDVSAPLLSRRCEAVRSGAPGTPRAVSGRRAAEGPPGAASSFPSLPSSAPAALRAASCSGWRSRRGSRKWAGAVGSRTWRPWGILTCSALASRPPRWSSPCPAGEAAARSLRRFPSRGGALWVRASGSPGAALLGRARSGGCRQRPAVEPSRGALRSQLAFNFWSCPKCRRGEGKKLPSGVIL